MYRVAGALAAVVTAMTASGALAMQAAAGGPGSALDVRYFEGCWDVAARDPVSGAVDKMTYRVEPLLGGIWLSGSGAVVGQPPQARDMWGVDIASAEVMRVVFDGSGAFAVVRSPGWIRDSLVLEGEVHQTKAKMRVRETIRRIGATEFEATWEALRGGTWQAYSIERVTRTTCAKTQLS